MKMNAHFKRKYWYIGIGCVVAIVAGVLIYIFASGKSSSFDYEELFNKYYGESTPETITHEGWWSVTGKFDGKNEETLTIFPIESSLCSHGEYDHGSYSEMLIKSKDGRSPDLIIDIKELDLEDNGFGFEFGNVYGNDILLSVESQSNGKTELNDGLGILIHPEGSTLMHKYVYSLIQGKWVLTNKELDKGEEYADEEDFY